MMTRRVLLARLACLPFVGSGLATAPATLPPIRQGVTFTKVGVFERQWLWQQRLGSGWRFFPYRGQDIVKHHLPGDSSSYGWKVVFSKSALREEGWRGWIENARGQVIAFVDRSWAVWGTP